jgi:hypothetical protein
MARTLPFALILSVAPSLLGGCGDPPPSPPVQEESAPTTMDTTPSGQARSHTPQGFYERSLAFVSADGDSVLIAPWSFRIRRDSQEEIRERDVRLGWLGSWEALAVDVDTGAVLGDSWRIVPGNRIRMIMGEGDALEEIFLRDPFLEMATDVGLPLARWTGSPREVARFHRGTTRLAPGEDEDAVERDGFLLDLGVSSGSVEGGWQDWIFVHSGDFFQGAFLQRAEPEGTEGDVAMNTFEGWTRFAVRERRWPSVEVEWTEVRSFEDARRDIPVAWKLRTAEGEMEILLEAESSHLSTGEGDGAVLPVDAFFQLRGELRMEGDTVPLLGVIRHRQP